MNTKNIIVVAALLATSATVSATSIAKGDYARFAGGLVDVVVVPAYLQHAESVGHLVVAMERLCVDPDASRLSAAREAFRRAMHAWQRARPIAFGPIAEGSGMARVQFWPDKRGTGARQIGKALAAEDPALLIPGALVTKSVALGDLQALERLLFDDDGLLMQPDGYRCQYAMAIARYQAELAQSLVNAWVEEGGHAQMVKTAANGNDEYFDTKEAAREFLKSYTATLAIIADLKLSRPMGDSIERARAKRAESWRSQQSMDNIIANIETLRALVDAPDGLADLLARAKEESLAEGLDGRLDQLERMARSLKVPLTDAIGDGEQRQRLIELRAQVQELGRFTDEVVAPKLELSKGFNATDGD
jgi:uncharacterized protein